MRLKRKFLICAPFIGALLFAASGASFAQDKLGIFELVHIADASFEDTASQVEKALEASPLILHAQHDLAIPGDVQKARIFILTSPALMASSAAEAPERASGQILRVAVYTHGQSQGTLINMANPVAHAMVFYSGADNYAAIVQAAEKVAAEIRLAVSDIPGTSMSVQLEPLRTENHYRKFKGDGPARMMTRFRNWEKSQIEIGEDSEENFDAVVASVAERLKTDQVTTLDEDSPWQLVSRIPVSKDAVYFGITNRFTEDRMIRINSDYRNDGKTEAAPFPGVDHAAALPIDVLVIKKDGQTQILHYGQMWRMQLYFWDSGYRAFTKNTMIPGAISSSIEDWLKP